MDMLKLPEVNSVLARAGEARAVIAEVTSFGETTAGDQDVILSPAIISNLLKVNPLGRKALLGRTCQVHKGTAENQVPEASLRCGCQC